MPELHENPLQKVRVMEEKRSFITRFEVRALVAIIVGAFLLRVIPQLKNVFVDGNVFFRGVDSWYHMRLADNLIQNFPFPLKWDAFAPSFTGGLVGFRPLLSASIALVGKLGFNYEVFAAFLPSILGSLIIIPTYFLAKELFSKKVAILSAVFVAILPGELLHRSLLGFTDHHIIEVLLTVTIILFIVLATRKSWKFSFGTGTCLGLLVLAWYGCPFTIVVIGLWFLIEFLTKHWRGQDTKQVCIIASVTGATALAISGWYLPGSLGQLTTAGALVALAASPWIVRFVARVVPSKRLFLSIIVVMIVGAILLINTRTNVQYHILSVFWGGGSTIGEARPLDVRTAMNVFGVPFLLMFGGLYLYIKNRGSLIFVLWTIIILVATFGQRKWGYYSTISVAMLSSYLIFYAQGWISKNVRYAAVAIIICFSILPSIRTIYAVATLPNNITPDWYDVLVWMRDNTSEPFEGSNAYYKLQVYEEPKYNVMSWWDYGHWINRIAHRVPLSDPGRQEEVESPAFFAATSIEEANQILNNSESKYIVYDKNVLEGNFHAIEQKAGVSVVAKDSFATKLWYSVIPGYELIYQSGDVKLFEYTELFD